MRTEASAAIPVGDELTEAEDVGVGRSVNGAGAGLEGVSLEGGVGGTVVAAGTGGPGTVGTGAASGRRTGFGCFSGSTTDSDPREELHSQAAVASTRNNRPTAASRARMA
jgi:hypothetical protein